jgi:pSer/pThr/pTyr-binding forkhead associated (FHA) protein
VLRKQNARGSHHDQHDAVLEDLKSKNGTMLDMVPVQGLTLLADGSLIDAGATPLNSACSQPLQRPTLSP